jgi:phosphoribosylformimino-5-aminoimidazole carboxamide ribotide isomerase
MRLIGVIDLAGGLAVHARGGDRARYAPVRNVVGREIHGNPLALAQTYREQFGLTELYVADLDAITAAVTPGSDVHQDAAAGRSAPHGSHDDILTSLAAGTPLWLDAAIAAPPQALRALERGATCAIVGLETLRSFDDLATICVTAGPERVAFGLDLRGGVPVAPRLDTSSSDPINLAARAADVGVGTVIVLDLARVGAATGPDIRLMARVRAATPGATLVAGGGVRAIDDLIGLADAGCDGALVATAIHHGKLNAEEMHRLSHISGNP